MNNNSHNLKRTPLRNSNLANKPFRSPFSNNSTPVKNNNSSKRQLPTLSPCINTSPKIELLSRHENAIKRRKLNIEINEPPSSSHSIREDLKLLQQRIRSKKLEIDSLKTKLAYRNKHNVKDLKNEITKWRRALWKALIQYQKDCQQRYTGEGTLDMPEILSMLGIPEKVAKFPNDLESIQ